MSILIKMTTSFLLLCCLGRKWIRSLGFPSCVFMCWVSLLLLVYPWWLLCLLSIVLLWCVWLSCFILVSHFLVATLVIGCYHGYGCSFIFWLLELKLICLISGMHWCTGSPVWYLLHLISFSLDVVFSLLLSSCVVL